LIELVKIFWQRRIWTPSFVGLQFQLWFNVSNSSINSYNPMQEIIKPWFSSVTASSLSVSQGMWNP